MVIIKTNYYEGIIKVMPDMSIEAYMEAIGLDKLLKGIHDDLYEKLIKITVKEKYNRGYFQDRKHLEDVLKAVYKHEGLDKAVNIFMSWYKRDLLNTSIKNLTESYAQSIVLYNCDETYRTIYQFNRILKRKLEELGADKIEVQGKTISKHLTEVEKRYGKRVREKPLEVISESVVGIKRNNKFDREKYLGMIKSNKRLYEHAIMIRDGEIKIVKVSYRFFKPLNKDSWFRCQVPESIVEEFNHDAKDGGESYSTKSGVVCGKITLNKRDLYNKWKKFTIDVTNGRYGFNIPYDAMAPDENDVVKMFYRLENLDSIDNTTEQAIINLMNGKKVFS